MATVPVPRLVGLSHAQAVINLTQAGLAEGCLTRVIASSAIDAVTRTIPSAGTQVESGAAIDLDISLGLWRKRWWENTSSLIFSSLAIITMVVMGIVFTTSYIRDGSLINSLAEPRTARGLTTFLIVFTTVVIALIIVVSTVVLEDSPENDKRFDRGKQVLSILIGVLGTIVGFYYGSAEKTDTKPQTDPKITTSTLVKGVVGKEYEITLQESGGAAPFKWESNPVLPKDLALSESGKISGKPAVASNQTYEFKVTDANGKQNISKLGLEVASQ